MDVAVDLAVHLCGFPIIGICGGPLIFKWVCVVIYQVPCVETKLYYEMVISPHTSQSQPLSNWLLWIDGDDSTYCGLAEYCNSPYPLAPLGN